MIFKEKKVLFIEDNENLSDLYSTFLNIKLKLSVYTANDGQKAYSMAEELKPDLIITDLMLPSISGLDLVELFKKNPELCHVPIIVVSAIGAKEQIVKCLAAGADYYLIKPVSFKQLEQNIKKLLKLK